MKQIIEGTFGREPDAWTTGGKNTPGPCEAHDDDGRKGDAMNSTPRKWVVQCQGPDEPIFILGPVPLNLFIAKMDGGNWESQYANAVFIVRACNSHDGLLEACKDALLLPPLVEKLEWLKRHADDLRSDFNEGSIEATEKQINHILGQLRTAIEAAEGGG